MDINSRISDPPQAISASIQAKEARVPPRLRYEQPEEHPFDIPDSIQAQGPPSFLGLTSRIPEAPPRWHVSITSQRRHTTLDHSRRTPRHPILGPSAPAVTSSHGNMSPRLMTIRTPLEVNRNFSSLGTPTAGQD